MDIGARIRGIIEPTVTDMGYEIVRVMLSGEKRRQLQIMAERADGQGMTVEDCADISRAVSALLDVEDPIEGAYTLEVSSPGVDRPLVRLKDFERFAGFVAKVETERPVAGRRRFKGCLRGVEADEVEIETDDGTHRIPFEDIARAKLVLTDELIEANERASS